MAQVLAAAAILATPSMGHAQSRDLQSLWIVQPSSAPMGDRALASGEFVLKQRLLPTGLAELGSDIALGGGKAKLVSGTQLIAAGTEGAKVFCIAEVAKQKLIGASFQPCLIDSDRDGDFDGWFSAVSQTKGLLTLAGKYPKKPKPIAETAYREVAPETMRDEYFVAIERRNYFNIYSRESFMIAFGREGQVDRLTAPISFKSTEMPRELTVMGAKFTAIAEQEGKMLVRVSAAMPRQPFGVMTSTTYNFY
ncbi:hypothetical protein E5A73_11600 [Sphingomonas gei]|uniref:Uncharacterized protein n=1 Tax=Sphingomonas gei TaxID=1395960 RepID=A0A4S1XCC6_9SPHN|nr:hypothetical protein [Sphingomonas gei]TGX53475.1 hypothetical protein E5A73_11600 [Sphingomonas gei]